MNNSQVLCIGLSVAWSYVCESKAHGYDKSVVQIFLYADIPSVYNTFKSKDAEVKILFSERDSDYHCTELKEIALEDVGKPQPAKEDGEILYEIYIDLTSSSLTFGEFNQLLKDWGVDDVTLVN